jgi:hypothetical protein
MELNIKKIEAYLESVKISARQFFITKCFGFHKPTKFFSAAAGWSDRLRSA